VRHLPVRCVALRHRGVTVRRVIRHLRHGLLVIPRCSSCSNHRPWCRIVAIPVLLLLFSLFLLVISPVLFIIVVSLVFVVVVSLVFVVVVSLVLVVLVSSVFVVRPVVRPAIRPVIRASSRWSSLSSSCPSSSFIPSFVLWFVPPFVPSFVHRLVRPSSSRRSSCGSLSSLSDSFHLHSWPGTTFASRPHPSSKGRGGCGYFERAHIPQERGGAPRVVNARGWVGVEEVGSMWWW
jgi:hypothetical protein